MTELLEPSILKCICGCQDDVRSVRIRIDGKATEYEQKEKLLCKLCRTLTMGHWKYASNVFR